MVTKPTLLSLVWILHFFSFTFAESHFVLTAEETSQNLGDVLSRIRRSLPPVLTSEPVVERFHVSSKVTSRYGRVQITSDVRNDATRAQEVSIDLRLPKTAFISNFSMEIDSVVYVGKVRAKAEAKAQYEKAVSQGQSAGLVTAKIREVQNFAVSVNVASGTTVTFRLNYEELLVRKLGVYKHVIYADPGQIVEDLMVEALISEPIGITSVEAAGPHRQNRERNRELSDEFDIGDDVEIRRSKTQSYVKYRPTVDQQRIMAGSDLSFTVTYDVLREELGGEILIKNGYFVHFFAPASLPIIPKNIVFIIDKSGSMHGSKIKQTKEALKTILDDLNDEDKFNILTFSSEAHVWQPREMMSKNSHNTRRAKHYVNRIDAEGGTNLYGAVMEGISLLDTINGNAANSFEAASMIVILTDGQPTVGITDTTQIINDVREQIGGRFSLFCLGFGPDVDHTFLQRLAHHNRGTSRQIYIDSDAGLQLKGFYDEVASPLLTHVILKYQGIRAEKLTTNTFHNHFDGSEIMVVGRLNQLRDGVASDDFFGIVHGRSVDGDVSLQTTGKELDETFIDENFDMEKVWAYLTIKDLLKNKTHNSDNEEQVRLIDAEILRLSIKFNFVTPLTSMVVTKPGNDVLADDTSPTPVPLPMPRPAPRGYNGNRGPSQAYLMSSLVSSNRMRMMSFPFKSRMMGSSSLSHLGFGGSPSVYQRLSPLLSRRTLMSAQPPPSVGAMYSTTTTRTTTTTTATPPPTTTRAWNREGPTQRVVYESNDKWWESSTTPFVNPLPEDPLQLDSRECGRNIVIASAVNITSPRFPGLYPTNSQCVWKIVLDQNFSGDNARLRLTFPSLDLESGSCNRDRILIYPDFDFDTSTVSQIYTRCGFSRENESLEASQNFVIVFQSDTIVSGRGFLANVDVL